MSSWNATYVVFRNQGKGNLVEVFQTSDFKGAKYWLTYIAEVGDVLCRTPSHPRYSRDDGKPEYWSHKEASGAVTADESLWQEQYVKGQGMNFIPA
jgi:hypothetical protein